MTPLILGISADVSFLNFLRGMETRHGDSLAGGEPSFLNFLRGMETFDEEAAGDILSFLPKLP